MSKQLFLVNLLLLIGLVVSSNLRKQGKEIKDIDILLDILPRKYISLYKTILKEKSHISKELTTKFFKQIESNSNIKYYFNKAEADYDSLIDDVINSMGISNKHHAYVTDTFKNQIGSNEVYFKYNKWINL